MVIRARRYTPAARRAAQKADLQEIGFIYVLQRDGLLSDRRGERLQPHRSAGKVLNDAQQHAPVDRVEAELIDLQQIERLVSAMADLRRRFRRTGTAGMLTQEYIPPQVVLSPQDAFYGRKVRLPLEQCEGRVCGEFVMCYPPGIPILAPGERITRDVLDYITYAKAKGCNLTGPEDLHTEYLNVLTKE